MTQDYNKGRARAFLARTAAALYEAALGRVPQPRHTPSGQPAAGAGVARARAREAAYRAQQEGRLKNAVYPPMSRQRRRWLARRGLLG